jgi:subtilisin-like proprotein convertase family protein
MKRKTGLIGIAALLMTSLVTLTCAERPNKSKAAPGLIRGAAASRGPAVAARPGGSSPPAARLRPMAARREAASVAGQAPAPIFGQAVAFGVSPEARDLPPPKGTPKEGGERKIREVPEPGEFRTRTAGDRKADPVIQRSAPVLATPSPTLSFDGMSNADNDAAIGFQLAPPDTNGDVGPNDYVQQVNLLVRVFDKTGVPRTPPFQLSSLWSTVGGQCSALDSGDVVVLYDPLADRWLLSQFAFADFFSPPYHECIAISQTPDPAGAYFLYDFVTVGANFPDYPKLGVWHDGYYMNVNQFLAPFFFFNGTGAYAFEKAKMLVGDPTAGMIYFNLDFDSHPEGLGGMLPSDLDGLTPPPLGRPNTFASFNATEFDNPSDALRLFDFHADFATPGNATFTERLESPIAVAAFDPLSPPGRTNILQPPPASADASLDAISDRLMHRLQYRNLGGSESLVVNHTVNVSGVSPPDLETYQAGVRYYELRRIGAGPYAVHEQATFAPDSDSRWMGSAATDNQGNLAVGYSVSSLTTFPSVRYAGRLFSDPPNGLFQGEATLIAGTGAQTDDFGATASRWGDYSALSVDPSDDCTFWYTNEYYTEASQNSSPVGWLTRIGNFKFAPCTPGPKGTLQGVVTNAATGLPIQGVLVQTSDGYLRTTDAGGSYSITVAPGTYNMTASKFAYQTGTASGVVVSNGGTTIQNFALTPIAVLLPAGSALTSENCNPDTGAIDPGERVTVAFSIKNIGAANTSHLVATLLATGGVTSPTGPQSYGVVIAGGPAVTKSFSFAASSALPCGGTLTAMLSLKDGGVSLGTVSYTFTLGAFSAGAASNSYSTGNIAVPIHDVTTVEIPIVVSDADGTSITDVNVSVRLNHTFDFDLTLSLVHPDGTVVLLSANNGGSGDNYGTGANDCSGTPTVFDDSAASPIFANSAPFAGTFRPESPLSALNGKPTNGTWKLRVTDGFFEDEGTVGCVKLDISRRVRLCCPFTGGSPVIGAVPPATLVAESCGAGNGAVDPGETVTVAFPLQNIGTGPTTNLVATLQPGGGVNGPSAPQSYGALSPLGAPVSRPFTFSASGTCGGNITATLQLQDGAKNLGTVAFTIHLGIIVSTSFGPFSNPASISILDASAASPYPSNIAVSGVTGPVSKVTVTLTNISHTFPSDIDILLVGPGGQKILLMSDAGDGDGIINQTLTFDDAAATPVPDPIVSGTYQPTNNGTGDFFPAPAPAGPYPDPQLLSVFNGVSPNGTWSLYVVDDAGFDVGNISGGWSLNITTSVPNCDFCSYLRGTGPDANPTVLFLGSGPTASTPKYRDSAGISLGGGNAYKEIGTWTATPPAGTLTSAGGLHTWIGLKNSDDIGTKFDLRVELHKNGVLFASGLARCIDGVSRSPDTAKELSVPFGSFSPTAFNGSTDVLGLKVLTRIGTSDGSCSGHGSATGLRLYFDSVNRPSSFEQNP